MKYAITIATEGDNFKAVCTLIIQAKNVDIAEAHLKSAMINAGWTEEVAEVVVNYKLYYITTLDVVDYTVMEEK